MTISFSSLGVPRTLTDSLAQRDILEPYPIQQATLPEALAGEDICAESPTGSGKTLAFAIPIVARLAATERARPKRPRALVLAPTRELAGQIAEEIRPLAKAERRFVDAFYGGTGFRDQLQSLNKGVDIVVGCPGRLIDLRDRGAISLRDVEIVVVDEADRMADMGFLPDVRRLLDDIDTDRQTLLFSATLTREVERLVREYQNDARRHVLDAPKDHMGSRTHEFWRSPRDRRNAVTAHLVSSHGSSIVFCRTKHGADRLARHLNQAGVPTVAIHGDRSQAQRERALAQFRSRRAQVLVGTDVAARGIHVEGVDCVVHFDPPGDDDTYIHRSGRTGRAGSSGLVVSLVSSDQERSTKQLVRRLGLDASMTAAPEVDGTIRPPVIASTLDNEPRNSNRPNRPYQHRGTSGSNRPTARNGGGNARFSGGGRPRSSSSGQRSRRASR